MHGLQRRTRLSRGPGLEGRAPVWSTSLRSREAVPEGIQQVKFESPVFSKASGSIGGMTFSHNRGGNYTRAKTTPSNPNSTAQQAQRALISSLTAAWGALTTAQRDAWNAYAIANPITDSMGNQRNAGGLGMFIQANSVRRLVGLSNITAAPTVNTPVVYTPVSIGTITLPAGTLSMSFTNTDEWAGAVGGALAFFVSRPQPQTINGFRGPFLYTDKVLGAATPPTSPKVITSPFPIVTGQKVFVRTVAVSADGRVSGQAITFRVA